MEAAELLGVGERTFRRWCQRFEEAGEAGLLDRRLGKVSGKRVPRGREIEVEALYRDRYSGFTAKHFGRVPTGGVALRCQAAREARPQWRRSERAACGGHRRFSGRVGLRNIHA